MPRTFLPWILGALLGILVVIGLGCEQRAWPAVKQRIRAEFPGVRQISAESLHAMLASADRPPILLDVREESEYRISHLRGALRIDPDDPRPALPGVEKDTPVVAYCSVGYRSSALVERLMRQGYSDVSNLEGSIFEWANRGYPVVRDGQEVRQVHPYDREWGRLLEEDLHADPANR